jgi:hypothetical protein
VTTVHPSNTTFRTIAGNVAYTSGLSLGMCPRSNGLAERAVQTIKKAWCKHVAHEHNALTWDTDGLAAILAGYRCTPHSASWASAHARILFAVDPALDAEQYFEQTGTH